MPPFPGLSLVPRERGEPRFKMDFRVVAGTVEEAEDFLGEIHGRPLFLGPPEQRVGAPREPRGGPPGPRRSAPSAAGLCVCKKRNFEAARTP